MNSLMDKTLTLVDKIKCLMDKTLTLVDKTKCLVDKMKILNKNH